jgi:lysophospholipase L1-like esterase
MKPWVLALRGSGGDVAPAPTQPRWVVYGDSVAEGWIASEPALAWPAIAGRAHGLDHVNLGYAGAARGELASAEQIGKLDADVITVCHGTNCWTRTPHSADQMRANTDAFLTVLRQDHPDTPIVVASPVVRPDAEAAPNRLGASLADLRAAMEEVVAKRIADGDERLTLVHGRDLVTAAQLGDGIHPDDSGHAAMAAGIGAAVATALAG